MTRYTLPAVVFILLAISASFAFSNDHLSLNDYGATLLERSDVAAALSRLQEAYASNPHDGTIRRNLAIALVVAGQRSLAAGRVEEAQDRFSRAVELFPDDGEYRLFHGISLHALKRYDHAAVEYDRAYSLMGESKGYYFHLGRLKYDTGMLDEALRLWEKGAALDPSDRELAALVEKARRELAAESSMGRGGSGRFHLSYDASLSPDTASRLLDALEEAYNRVGSYLDHYPAERVQVLVYTRTSFREVVRGPDWSGGVYDGKIRLPLGGVREITDEVKALLFHEYAHAAIFSLTRGNVPMWLNEGLAELLSRLPLSAPPHPGEGVGELLPLSVLEGSFTPLSSADARRAYAQSLSLVSFVADRYGSHTIGDLLRRLGEGRGRREAIDAVLSPFGVTFEELFAQWRQSLLQGAEPSTKP